MGLISKMIVLLVEVWFMDFYACYDDGARDRVYLA